MKTGCIHCHSRRIEKDRATISYVRRLPVTVLANVTESVHEGVKDTDRMLLVLQYYDGDKDHVFDLARLICQLHPKPYEKVDFLLAARYDATPAPPDVLFTLAQVFPNVTFYRSTRCARGWPHGPNELWYDTVTHLYEMQDAGKSPVYENILFMEGDDCPLVPNWVEMLREEWRKRKVHVMGHVIPDVGGRDHVNGNLMLSGATPALRFIAKKKACNPKQGWDWEIAPTFAKWGWFDTILIRSAWQKKTSDDQYFHVLLDQGTVFHHGVKDTTLRDIVRKFYYLEDEIVTTLQVS